MNKKLCAFLLGLFSCGVVFAQVQKVSFVDKASRVSTPEEKIILDAAPKKGISPFAIGFVPEAQMPAPSYDIYGLSIGIFSSKHRALYGIGASTLMSMVDDEFIGVQVSGLYNNIGKSEFVLQVAGFVNTCDMDMAGLQVSCINNKVVRDMSGLQISLVNDAGTLEGLQIGLFNKAMYGKGVQIGVFNAAYRLRGLQIGLLNLNEASSVPFMPIINCAF